MNRLCWSLIMVAVLFTVGEIVPVRAESKSDIEIKDGKVSVDLVEADLTEVLKKINKDARIEIIVNEGVSGLISLKFKDASLQESLKMIIGQHDYAFEYIGDRLSTIQVFKKNEGKQVVGCKIKYDEKVQLISFLDCEGKVIKKIKLHPCQTALFPQTKTLSGDNSKEQKYVIVSSPAENMIDENSKCDDLKHRKVTFYDNSGKILWEKDYGWERAISGDIQDPSIILTDNGKRVIVTTSTFNEARKIEHIYIYDKQGNELIRIPEYGKEGNFEFFSSEIDLSSNGKYLAIKLRYANESLYNFYNLKEGTSWEVPQNYSVYYITNEGFVNGVDIENRRSINIDLKEYLE